MTVFPLTVPIEVSQPVVHINMLGEEEIIPGEYKRVMVFSWAVTKSEEKTDDSVLRTIDVLAVYMQPEDVTNAGAMFRLGDGTEWEQVGNPEDYNNNPWWSPGLVVVNAKKVED